MTALDVETVDTIVGAELDAFAADEGVHRRRTEDLLASVLTLYGAAFRRVRTIIERHEPDRFDRWGTAEPLRSLLRLHLADGPEPPPIPDDDLARARDAVDTIIHDLDHASSTVRTRVATALAAVTDLHEIGLAQATGRVGPARRLSSTTTRAILADDVVAELLLAHDLHPDPPRPADTAPAPGAVFIPLSAVTARRATDGPPR